jgi:biopolymer transport protein ExbB
LSRIITLTLTLLVVACLAASSPALAQNDNAPAANGASDSSSIRLFDHFVIKGGKITMFVLIPLSLATIALIVEHSITIRQRKILPALTVENIRNGLNEKRYIDVVKGTANDPSMLAAAINAGMAQAANGYAAMVRTADDVVDHRSGRLMRKIEYLNVIGNVSPMIGLFGTVYGMIGLFASIREAGGIPEPARIADDISIALVTTFWGLLVAIPALSAFAFFRNRIDELTAECSATVDRVLSVFEPANDEGSAERLMAEAI